MDIAIIIIAIDIIVIFDFDIDKVRNRNAVNNGNIDDLEPVKTVEIVNIYISNIYTAFHTRPFN